MLTITTKRKTLVTLPANLLVMGKKTASSHAVSFSEYLAQLLEKDLREREEQIPATK
jgi:predicted DNA binding CopG/RHH family protein